MHGHPRVADIVDDGLLPNDGQLAHSANSSRKRTEEATRPRCTANHHAGVKLLSIKLSPSSNHAKGAGTDKAEGNCQK